MGQPTEEELGIEMTPAEQAILDAPIQTAPEDDDIRQEDDAEDEALIAAKPTRAKDPATGKFLPKDAAPADGSKPDVVTPEGKTAPPAPPPGYVDIKAMQEERALRRQTEERMNVLLEVLQKREARAAKADEPQAPAKPDIDVDPRGYVATLDERLAKIEGETAAQTKAREANEAEDRSYNEALAIARPQFEEAATAEPLIKAQYSELLNSYAKEIVYLNQNNPDFKRDPRAFLGKAMTKLEGDHIRYAQQTGQHLGAYIKGLAESRGIDAAFVQAKIGQGGQQQPSAQQRQQPSIADRRQAQARHMSVGDLPGGAVPTTINAKDLVKMSSKDFAAFAKSMGDDKLDQLFLKA